VRELTIRGVLGKFPQGFAPWTVNALGLGKSSCTTRSNASRSSFSMSILRYQFNKRSKPDRDVAQAAGEDFPESSVVPTATSTAKTA
jgi:hypothetical protein